MRFGDGGVSTAIAFPLPENPSPLQQGSHSAERQWGLRLGSAAALGVREQAGCTGRATITASGWRARISIGPSPDRACYHKAGDEVEKGRQQSSACWDRCLGEAGLGAVMGRTGRVATTLNGAPASPDGIASTGLSWAILMMGRECSGWQHGSMRCKLHGSGSPRRG